MTREQADEVIRLRERHLVPGTIEAIARAVACGELDTRAGNAVLIAANAAIQSIESNEKASMRGAADMTDEELENHVEAVILERQARIESNQ